MRRRGPNHHRHHRQHRQHRLLDLNNHGPDEEEKEEEKEEEEEEEKEEDGEEVTYSGDGDLRYFLLFFNRFIKFFRSPGGSTLCFRRWASGAM